MKKNYIAPATLTVATETMNIVCASLGSGDTPTFNLDDTIETVDNGSADARRFIVWDDDEDIDQW